MQATPINAVLSSMLYLPFRRLLRLSSLSRGDNNLSEHNAEKPGQLRALGLQHAAIAAAGAGWASRQDARPRSGILHGMLVPYLQSFGSQE